MCAIVHGWELGRTPYRERSWARREREIVCSVERANGAGVGGGPCVRVTADQKVVLRRVKMPSFSCWVVIGAGFGARTGVMVEGSDERLCFAVEKPDALAV